METLKDIFVPYKIAQKLKEIGFDEPCIAYYDDRYCLYMWHSIMTKKVSVEEELSICNFNESNPYDNIISAPTYEQVFKWFREKGIDSSLFTENGYYYYRGSKGDKFLFSGTESYYEQAQEQLILKLIEIYEKGKN